MKSSSQRGHWARDCPIKLGTGQGQDEPQGGQTALYTPISGRVNPASPYPHPAIILWNKE